MKSTTFLLAVFGLFTAAMAINTEEIASEKGGMCGPDRRGHICFKCPRGLYCIDEYDLSNGYDKGDECDDLSPKKGTCMTKEDFIRKRKEAI